MGEITKRVPKPMLSVLGRNLIQHKIDILPSSIDEVIIVTGHLEVQIKEFFKDKYEGRKITYVTQEELNGTGGAVWQAKDVIKGKFLVMMGDDIYFKDDIEKCVEYDWAILGKRVEVQTKGNQIIVDEKGRIMTVTQDTDLKPGDFNNSGLYVMGKEVFNYPLVKIPNGEYGLPQTLAQVVKDFPIHIVEATEIIRVTSPGDIKKAEEFLTAIVQ